MSVSISVSFVCVCVYVNCSSSSKHLFQQMCLKKMSQVRSQLIELNPRLDLVPLIRAGLDSEVAGFREEEHGDKDAMAKV